MKKFFLPGVVLATLVIVIAGVFFTSKDNSTSLPLPTSYEYFWGDGCPHCATVQEFFDTWDKKDKVSIDKKEVWSNKENALLMRERASYCHLPLSSLAVPFLFTPEGKCISGDQPIINLFKSLNL